ncbi:MAG: large conductance mechanosensitive channel protein MscL [Eubacterium sp.]|nr:large conductance mechanosensitive channel protein MscL [Eubacterium sp.]
MVDLAVGVIIGAAFKAIVDSLVDDIISPILGLFLRGNLSSLSISLFEGRVTICYGAFFTAIINFVIMAFIIFLMIKGLNALRRIGKKGEEEETEKTCPYCQMKIDIKATKCPHCTSDVE